MGIRESTIGMNNANKGKIQLSIDSSSMQWLVLILLSALYLLRDIYGVVFPDLIFSGLCAAAFLVLDSGYSLGVYIFTTALTLPHNEIMIFYVIMILLKQYRDGKIRLQSGMTLLTVSLLVLQMIDMALFDKSSWMTIVYDYITRMLYVVIPMLWFSCEMPPATYRRSMICFVWGMLLGAAVVMILTARMIGWEALVRGSEFQRLGVTTQAGSSGMRTSYNANQLGGMMAISIALLFVAIEKKTLPKLIGWGGVAFAILIIIMSKSRSSLLCACGVGLLYFEYIMVKRKKWLLGITYLMIVTIIIFAITQLFPDLLTGILTRLQTEEDITNGRVDLFAIYVQEWSSNAWCLLFGYGIGSYQDVVTTYNVPHNFIPDVLISWGGIGFLLLTCMLVMFYRASRAKLFSSERFLAFTPVIVAFVLTLAGQYLTTGFPHTRLCFLLLSAQGWHTMNDINA